MTYPTTCNLEGFIEDLHRRASFIQKWIDNGFPQRIQLSGIMYPDCLITALLQVCTYQLWPGKSEEKYVFNISK